MMMRMLEAAGLDVLTDQIREADEDNPEGYYELAQVKSLVRGDQDWVPEARGRVVKVVSPLLRYLPDDQEYRIILMRRDMDEVLASQREMLRRRGQPGRTSDEIRLAQLFDEDLRQIQGWMERQANVRYLQVNYNQILADPSCELPRLAEFLGDDLNLDAMADVVNPELYRQRG